ncbi:hypothetical protein DLAC_01821 [Tieghemostelium lacteum]|uniref:UspA domain-containing protein n=1 Tax=Tieghemostelium lacteum TaxID=361077 RepID=A0A152A6F1_TIELA|nr:hypothetical protein DLAC_01821 [Tieghemostelium lacteum]|eukprot:KYR01808.1 hypothetical protein DLAC_01821 [Tieghemostelium lacteum]
MVNFMIAVESSDIEHTLNEVVSHIFNKQNDHLFFITIVEDITNFPSSPMSTVFIADSMKIIERKHKDILIECCNKAQGLGLSNIKALLGHGSNAGDHICKAAKEKQIDYLVVGRRSMGSIKRIFMGSTSKYILEHAPCNVICIKDLPQTQPPHEEPKPQSNNIEQIQIQPQHEQQSQQQPPIHNHDDSDMDQYNFERLNLHV